MKNLIFFLCVFLAVSAGAQTPYISQKSIGKSDEVKENNMYYGPLDFKAIEATIGEKYIFMPQRKPLQKYGYSIGHYDYQDNVGKIVTLKSYSNLQGVFIDSIGKEYYFTAYSQHLEGMTPLGDLLYARKTFINKRLWVNLVFLNTYNVETDKTGVINVDRFSEVKIIDVVLSTDENAPIRFILKTPSGKEGFVDLIISGTNINPMFLKFNNFKNNFFTYDPQKKYHYSPRMWKYIKDGLVINGMNKEQVLLAKGIPDNKNYSSYGRRNSEQWIYGEGATREYLYFDGNVLTAQN